MFQSPPTSVDIGWAMLGHAGPCWAMLGRFCPGTICVPLVETTALGVLGLGKKLRTVQFAPAQGWDHAHI